MEGWGRIIFRQFWTFHVKKENPFSFYRRLRLSDWNLIKFKIFGGIFGVKIFINFSYRQVVTSNQVYQHRSPFSCEWLYIQRKNSRNKFHGFPRGFFFWTSVAFTAYNCQHFSTVFVYDNRNYVKMNQMKRNDM